MRHILKWLLLSIFVIVSLLIGWVWYRTSALGKAFAQVQQGDSPARVIALFDSRPYVTTNTETNIDWNETWENNGVKCILQFHFSPPFSICGESWVVGFDEHSNAVAKYFISSP